MASSSEKEAFAKRLREHLPRDIKGGTALAREFNLRHQLGDPVSAQTAHKWYTGLTIPKPEKLLTLAEWLKVDVHYLHYGPSPTANPKKAARPKHKYPPSPESIDLATKIESLPPKDRNFVEEFVERLYGDDQHGE